MILAASRLRKHLPHTRLTGKEIGECILPSVKLHTTQSSLDGRLTYTLAEVEGLTGVPRSSLRTLIRRGKLNPITAFGKWRILATELESLLAMRLRNDR